MERRSCLVLGLVSTFSGKFVFGWVALWMYEIQINKAPYRIMLMLSGVSLMFVNPARLYLQCCPEMFAGKLQCNCFDSGINKIHCCVKHTTNPAYFPEFHFKIPGWSTANRIVVHLIINCTKRNARINQDSDINCNYYYGWWFCGGSLLS